MQILSTVVENDDELTITTHTVNVLFTLACGATTTITAINIVEEEDCGTHISAMHTNDAEGIELALYNDNAEAFEAVITSIIGKEVCFTESGMQDNGYASMEF